MAIILDDLHKLGVCGARGVIEEAVSDGCGNPHDNRYFLREGVEASTIQGQPKSNVRKARCCTIKKEILASEVLRRMYHGM